MRESVKKKGHAGFNIPFGYDYINGELRIILDEAKIVKDIYSWYLSGRSMGEIAKMLNMAKIPTKKGGVLGEKDGFVDFKESSLLWISKMERHNI